MVMTKLHLGCGKRNLGEDWIHIDGGDFPHLVSNDITMLAYENNSVDVIYASHVLEYFDYQEVQEVLAEWYRVLKPEGELFLSVPDFEVMSELYLGERVPLCKLEGPIFGKMEMGDEIIYHKQVYDFSRLGDLLNTIGFKRLERYEPQELIGDTDDHSKAMINNKLISLNIKCKK
jgi:predicted SAM-dependent methyltransferase